MATTAAVVEANVAATIAAIRVTVIVYVGRPQAVSKQEQKQTFYWRPVDTQTRTGGLEMHDLLARINWVSSLHSMQKVHGIMLCSDVTVRR